jgi:hypothetical protein
MPYGPSTPVDTLPRRGELARALGYWAARYHEGQPAGPPRPADDVRMAVVRAAADGARRYLARPDIVHLHGVTGAMAVEILAAHIPATGSAAALAQVRAEHAALYAATEPVTQPHPAAPGRPARRRAHRGGRAQPGPAPGEARRGLLARARGNRRSRLRRRRNGHRPARLTGS